MPTPASFLQALRVGPRSLEDPERLVVVAASVHANALWFTAPPPEPALALCDGYRIKALSPPFKLADGFYHPSLILRSRGLSLVQLRRTPASFPGREEWARFLRKRCDQARAAGAAGIVALDSDLLLQDPSLRWHVQQCYRWVQPMESCLDVAGWSPDIAVPVRSTLETTPLSRLEIRWELLDDEKVAARGLAVGSDDPPVARLRLQALNPDAWSGAPAVRLFFHLPVIEAEGERGRQGDKETRRQGEGETRGAESGVRDAGFGEGGAVGDSVVVVRRPQSVDAGASAPVGGGAVVALTGEGPEVSRLQAPIRIVLPVECDLQAESVVSPPSDDAIVNLTLRNRTPTRLDPELRVTLRSSLRGIHTILSGTVSIPSGGQDCRQIRVPAQLLGEGENYLLAGWQSVAGTGLKACLLYRTRESCLYLRNTASNLARFWLPRDLDSVPLADTGPGLKPEGLQSVRAEFLAAGLPPSPRLITLDGGEEKVIPLRTLHTAADPPANEQWTALLRDLLSSVQRSGNGPSAPSALAWDGGKAGACDVQAMWPEPAAAEFKARLYPCGLVLWSLVPGRSSWVEFQTPPGWNEVRWWREAFWDLYPRDHPDAPRGLRYLPLELSGVQRAVLSGDGGGLAILPDRGPLDLQLSPGLLRIRSSDARAAITGGGFLVVANPADAEGLWLRPPPFVCTARYGPA